jgi:hypothetical protein
MRLLRPSPNLERSMVAQPDSFHRLLHPRVPAGLMTLPASRRFLRQPSLLSTQAVYGSHHSSEEDRRPSTGAP